MAASRRRSPSVRKRSSPAGSGTEWRTIGEVVDASGGSLEKDPYVRSLTSMLQAYAGNDPATFNAEVKNYRAMVEKAVPAVVAKADFETRFNLAAPFIIDSWLVATTASSSKPTAMQ